MLSGVARKNGKGVPLCVFQEELKTQEAIARAQWTLKVAHLKRDPEMPNMVAISLYDSKPFYLISNCCSNVKWVKKKGSVPQGIKVNGQGSVSSIEPCR